MEWLVSCERERWLMEEESKGMRDELLCGRCREKKG